MYIFKDTMPASCCDMELHWQVDVDQASSKHAKGAAPTPSIPETHRAPSQMHLRTSGIFGGQGYTACGPAAALDHAAERPPSTDLSIGGGLVASAPLGVPSGHPEGGSEGVPPPLRLESGPFPPFPAVSDPRLACRLRVCRCIRARVGGRRLCWRARVLRQHAWGAWGRAACARLACRGSRSRNSAPARDCCEYML